MANPIQEILKESPSLRRLTTMVGLYYSILLIALIYLFFDFIIEKMSPSSGDDSV